MADPKQPNPSAQADSAAPPPAPLTAQPTAPLPPGGAGAAITDGATVDLPPPPPPVEPTRMVKLEKREKRTRARVAKEARLVVKRAGIPPAEVMLNRARTLIGRDRDHCDVVLDEDSVSRQHASVTREPTGYFVLHDLGSRNGVLVRGRRTERRTLLDGDEFAIGETTFTFQEIKKDKPPEPGKT